METKCCGTCKGQPAGGNGESVMDWTPLEITAPADREAMAQTLFRYGYTVRQRRRKDGNKTVIYIEYRRENGV